MHDALSGVRVVSLAVNLPGPLAAARLCAMGAEVMKIEAPAGDPLAAFAPSWYAELTEGQRVKVLNLKDVDDRAALDVELAGADLLITAMRPSALRGLGLGEAEVKYPGLSHVEIVGYDGDLEDIPGHDLNYQATYGTLQPPLMPSVPIADVLGSERAVAMALLALRITAQTGVGQRFRVTLDEAAAYAGASVRHGLSGAQGLGGGVPSYGIYQTADGYIASGALEPHFRDRLLAALGVEHTHAALERAFAAEKTEHWVELGVAADIPLTAVRG